MPLPKSFTTVTRFSATLAAIFFLTLPLVGFYIGTKYEERLTPQKAQSNDFCARAECAGECKNNHCYSPTPKIAPTKPHLKSCPHLAYKNPEEKTCSYSGPNCDLTCK